jgi:cell wall-associated NlpC family hydrolase
MTEALERAAVVAEAMTWLRTPYLSHARLKGVGVDCANLPAAVYAACGLMPEVRPEYSEQWYEHRDEELFLQFVTPFSTEITRDQVRPGDFAIWKFGRTFSHGAIVIDPPTIVHATLRGACVHLGDMERDDDLGMRPRRFFTLWGGKHGGR